MKSGDLCLVTGASGYLSSWIAKYLIEAGFRVRGTVRSFDNEVNVRTIHALLPGVELVAANLRAPTGWAEAVAGCCWVFHVASPQYVVTETNRTFAAVQGAEHLMRAALASISVEKVVMTSSEAAITFGHSRHKRHFTEDDWTVLDGPAGRHDYMRSKTLAERLAWNLAEDSSVNHRAVPLAVINPSFIAGPSLVPWERYSLGMIKRVAEGAMPVIPDMVNYVVDVRDCARMHIAVMNDPSTNGHRHFSFSAVCKIADWAQMIRDRYEKIGLTPKAWVVPTSLVWLLQPFSRDLAAVYSKLGHSNAYETKWPEVYRYVHTDLSGIVESSIDSVLEHGWIKSEQTRKTQRRRYSGL